MCVHGVDVINPSVKGCGSAFNCSCMTGYKVMLGRTAVACVSHRLCKMSCLQVTFITFLCACVCNLTSC